MLFLRRSPVTLAMLLSACSGTAPVPTRAPEYALTHQELLPLREQNHAYQWHNIMQEVAARDVERHGARPPVLSRQMMIWAVSMFDAWAAYDDKAVGSRLGGSLRRPPEERTLANKNKAIAHASYRALLGVYAPDAAFLRERMQALGFDPDDASTDPTTPQGIGNTVAAAVLAYRMHDGSNQLGDEPGCDGTPYSDYTNYKPVNPPDRIVDPDRWQPITFTRPDGTKFTPGFLTPHWYRVEPFALESSAQFRAEPLPLTTTNDALLREQTATVLAMNDSLTPQQKAIVEFMRDGPRSTGQSGHWLRFAQDVSRRDHHDLDRDVKLYFAIAVAAFDAFIACWETKRHYDSSRPWTLVRHYYRGQKVKGWAGPQGGVVEMPAEEWHPYSPYVFITPPFPGYTSGHATVSGACAKVLELFTGSDRYGAVEVRNCCTMTETTRGDQVGLDLPTFSATAEMAARSRALGGYHIPIDNDVGLRIGRELAVWSWPKYCSYWEGTATVRPVRAAPPR
ncbi:MAG TPA: vanadium-dependent haloperoxidase [Planctomycetota bacterium]|nr:vanadium-dependent haloperoxidase [Planctomycetota bacterium]